MKPTAIDWLESRITILIPNDIGSELMYKNSIKQAKQMEKIEKLKRQLFIGKVQEIIGFEKTIELLKECNETFKDAAL